MGHWVQVGLKIDRNMVSIRYGIALRFNIVLSNSIVCFIVCLTEYCMTTVNSNLFLFYSCEGERIVVMTDCASDCDYTS